MKKWSREELEAVGYKIDNAKITSVDLSMADHGVLCLELGLEGGGWGCVYGGYVLGKGYVGAKEFEDNKGSMEYIMRIMDVVGVSRFNDMKNKIIRVARKGWGDPIKIIGNCIKENWFDTVSFFEENNN